MTLVQNVVRFLNSQSACSMLLIGHYMIETIDCTCTTFANSVHKKYQEKYRLLVLTKEMLHARKDFFLWSQFLKKKKKIIYVIIKK